MISKGTKIAQKIPNRRAMSMSRLEWSGLFVHFINSLIFSRSEYRQSNTIAVKMPPTNNPTSAFSKTLLLFIFDLEQSLSSLILVLFVTEWHDQTHKQYFEVCGYHGDQEHDTLKIHKSIRVFVKVLSEVCHERVEEGESY